MEWMAALPWTRWPASRGSSGQNQWNTHTLLTKSFSLSRFDYFPRLFVLSHLYKAT